MKKRLTDLQKFIVSRRDMDWFLGIKENSILEMNRAMHECYKLREEILGELKKRIELYRGNEILTPREYKIIKMRFGKRMTLEDVGREFGVSRDRIRQIEWVALEKISDYEHPSRTLNNKSPV